MRIFLRPALAASAALLLGLASCNKGGNFAKTKSGIEYQIFKKEGGKYVPRELKNGEDPTYKSRQGKYLLAHVYVLTGKDSLLQSTRQQVQNHPVPLPLMPVSRKGGQEEAFALVQPGDSAVFRFQADSIFKGPGQKVPKELKRGGNALQFRIVGVKVIDMSEAVVVDQELRQLAQAEQQRQMRAYAADQDKKDKVIIEDYLKKNGLAAAKPTAAGVYVLVSQAGTGAKAKPGQQVQVKYRGTLLNGQVFDSSDQQPGGAISFPLGVGQVIPGWDDALQQLSKGAKATIIIPSSLAYGKNGAPPKIPANSPLRFDVELKDVQAATASAPGLAPAPGLSKK